MILFILKLLLIAFIIAAFLFAFTIVQATLTDYQPEEVEEVALAGKDINTKVPQELSFLIWNLGFAGFGSESDFFYDGGKMVTPKKQWSFKNFKGITKTLQSTPQTDFILLQEIDTRAKRSWYINHVSRLAEALPNYNYAFTPNFKVEHIPYPFFNPVGDVESGLATYSRYQIKENTRHKLPGKYKWPLSLFFLDRCFLMQRIPTQNGKELIVINTHKSAYDKGRFKQHQMEVLKTTLLEEYDKGNYVIVGGDWNQCPNSFDQNTFLKPGMTPETEACLDPNYLPDWQWAFDPTIPSNRKLYKPFNIDKTFCTLLDYYLLSPNVELVMVKGIDQQFAYSDHQPVFMKVRLK